MKIWCFSKNFKQTIILCNCFHILEKTLHTTCTCEDSTVICWNASHHWYGIFGPCWTLNIAIAMAAVLSWTVSSRTSTSGVCQDSFRIPGANVSRQWKWVYAGLLRHGFVDTSKNNYGYCSHEYWLKGGEGPVCWVQCANMRQDCSLTAVRRKTAFVEQPWFITAWT